MVPREDMIHILKTKDTIVRIVKIDNTYSIGVNDGKDFQWKYISEELYNLLKKELAEQEGRRF